MNEYPPRVSEAATEIAHAYASFGNLSSLYLGQTSATIHLRLFPLLCEEAAALYDANHPGQAGQESEAAELYRKSDDQRSLFRARCRKIVESDPFWATLQGKRRTTLPQSENDPGYAATNRAYEALSR